MSFRGLRGFKGSGAAPPAVDGEFVMQYIGSGQRQGELARTQFTVPAGRIHDIDLPFIQYPTVLGKWESVDLVADPADFNPDKQSWKGGLYPKELTFLADGKTAKPWWTRIKGVVIHHGDKTTGRYDIRNIKGQACLFFEWKSGDVTISGMKPHY